MKNAAPLLIVIGVLVGPTYYYFCELLSGQVAQTHALTERANRWELPDGAILRVKSGLAFKPVVLDLNPELNEYRLRFNFDVIRRDAIAAGSRNSYQVSLLQGDTTVLERSFEVTDSGKILRTLESFEVFYPGSYVLLLEEAGTPALGVAGVKFELLHRVEKPRMWLVWSGLVMLGFGIMLVLREVLQKSLPR